METSDEKCLFGKREELPEKKQFLSLWVCRLENGGRCCRDIAVGTAVADGPPRRSVPERVLCVKGFLANFGGRVSSAHRILVVFLASSPVSTW